VSLDTLVGSILNAMGISIHQRRRAAALFQRALVEGPAVLSELAGLGGGGPLLAPGQSLLRLHERVAEVRSEPAPICAVCREPPQPGSACILCCCYGVMCVACLDRCPTCPLCRCRRCSAALVPPLDAPPPPPPLPTPPPPPLPMPPPPPPPVDVPSPLLAVLLERLRHAATVSRTYSCVFVPFAHALLQDGEMAAEVAAWAAHDPAWAALLGRYREFFEASPRLAPLLQPNAVRDINLAAQPGWPYIEPAPEQEDPALRGRQDEPWPLQSPGRGFTQEGLLSQSPRLFQELQFMVRRWEQALPPPPPPPPPPDPTPVTPPRPPAPDAPPPAPRRPPLPASALRGASLDAFVQVVGEPPPGRSMQHLLREAEAGPRLRAAYELAVAALERLGHSIDHSLPAVVDEIASSVLGDVMYDHAHLRRRPELREHMLRGTEREVRARLAGLINAMHGGGLPTTHRRIRFDAAAHGGGGGRAAAVLRLLV